VQLHAATVILAISKSHHDLADESLVVNKSLLTAHTSSNGVLLSGIDQLGPAQPAMCVVSITL
jgi:hypothetical protein